MKLSKQCGSSVRVVSRAARVGAWLGVALLSGCEGSSVVGPSTISSDAGLADVSVADVSVADVRVVDVGPSAMQAPANRPQPGMRPPPIAGPAAFGSPLTGLTPAQIQAFTDGLEEFQNQETVEGGLGPLFNNTGCFVCHGVPATGGSTNLHVTRFGRLTAGVFDPMENEGGSLMQQSAIDRSAREFIPSTANVTARRQSTALFGLGLVEAIDDATIIANALTEMPAVRGTVAMVMDVTTNTMRVGRFGWKAQQATLLAFSGDAYVNEMGITNRFYPTENAPNGDLARLAASDTVADPEDQVDPVTGMADIDHAADFMRYLAPPPPLPPSPSIMTGSMVFGATGCADCHNPSMTTGASAVAALDHQVVHLFSDLLLHDMGSLGDGIAQSPATTTQMKTAVLWGIRASAPYLHDGRANTLDAAILAHEGQGAPSRDRYRALNAMQRQQLLDFLGAI